MLHLNNKITGQTGNYGTKKIKLMVSLKCLSNFWRIDETPLINCEVIFFLAWSEEYVIATEIVDD